MYQNDFNRINIPSRKKYVGDQTTEMRVFLSSMYKHYRWQLKVSVKH